MDDEKAYDLIDAHLDHQTLTDEESDQLSLWIKSNPDNADAAFFRVFLHSYLRFRIRTGLPQPTPHHSRSPQPLIDVVPSPARITSEDHRLKPTTRLLAASLIAASLLIGLSVASWHWWSNRNLEVILPLPVPHEDLWAYEGFDYPATKMTLSDNGELIWPTTGGMHGLNGGLGWSEPWRETNSKVAIIFNYDSEQNLPWQTNDMRKFGPLHYTDANDHHLETTGNELRTATTPRSITARRFDFQHFPTSMRDEGGLGSDGSTIWLSFLAQSSHSSATENHYSYLVIGSKEISGLRIGKLGAAPSGNWTAVGLLTGAEVNLKTSVVPSGEMVFLVARVDFNEGAEDALVWINPPLDREPKPAEAAMHLEVPDFRFDGIAIHANHSSDFDEIRFGGSFQAVTPWN